MCLRICRRNHPGLSQLRPYRYAHRGLYDLAKGVPENTLPAFRRAVDHGFGAELDVHLTADGRLVVIHDSDLTRLCGISRRADTLTAAEYGKYGILGTDLHAPMLEDILPLFEGKTPLIVEVKTDGANYAAVTAATCQMLDQFHVTYCMESFDPRVLIWLRKHRPEICRGQLSCNFAKEPESPLHPFLRWSMTRLLGNFLTRPDFIAYKFEDRNSPSLRLCRRYGAQEVSWTIRSQKDLDAAEQDGCIPIFEGFFPSSRKSTEL